MYVFVHVFVSCLMNVDREKFTIIFTIKLMELSLKNWNGTFYSKWYYNDEAGCYMGLSCTDTKNCQKENQVQESSKLNIINKTRIPCTLHGAIPLIDHHLASSHNCQYNPPCDSLKEYLNIPSRVHIHLHVSQAHYSLEEKILAT